jgi:hypothetical protein
MGWLDDLSPHARVATAVLPFLIAILVRVFVGKTKITSLLFSVGTIWFAINVLMAPYSARMQQDILELRSLFR